ncbi:hypothetical protein ACFV4F_14445 [Kitasatospora sp. NPDC059722]|uniref:hypothetical protein n=1 Tax=unclassified Kitasatospora TaxID=2633591 RepID=UPI0036608560
MSAEKHELEELVAGGAPFMDVLEFVRTSLPDELTPVRFLLAVQDELGISFTETRTVLEFFDPQLQPLVDLKEIDGRWNEIVQRWASKGTRA